MIPAVAEPQIVNLAITTVIFRILVAAFLGAVLGFERELKDRPAGLRTYMLVSLASSLFTILIYEIAADAQRAGIGQNIDIGRVVDAVTGGVAFLAAGAIIQARGHVVGITTGAGMWLAGAIGVACGAGYILIAALATALALIILAFLKKLSVMLENEPFVFAGWGAKKTDKPDSKKPEGDDGSERSD